MFIWVALKENVKEARILWIITEFCSNREFSAGRVEKLPFPQNLRISSWSYDMVSVHGPVADLCGQLARDSSSAGKPAANENLGSKVTPTEFPNVNTILRLTRMHRETCCENTSRISQNFRNNRN